MTQQTAITPVTEAQKKQFRRFVEDAADKALQETSLDGPAIQRLFMSGGVFQQHVIEAILECSTFSRFVGEEVESACVYAKDYKGVRTLSDQARRLRIAFPHLQSFDAKLATYPLPKSMTNEEGGHFAIPHWRLIAKTYTAAVEAVIAKVAESRRFYNYREAQIGLHFLQEHPRSAIFWNRLRKEQKKFDILVVPAQFGLLHRGRSVRRAREMFQSHEFGLGVYATGIMLLTHPDRLTSTVDLYVDCPGDKYAIRAKGSLSHTLRWKFGELGLELTSCPFSAPGTNAAPISAFFQQPA